MTVLNFIKQSGRGLLAVLSRAGATIQVNKLFALTFGTTGIALLGHFQNLVSLLTLMPNDGVNRGLIKGWNQQPPPPGGRHALWWGGIAMHIILFIGTYSLLLAGRHTFFERFWPANGGVLLYVLLAVAVLLLLAHLYYLTLLQATHNFATFAWVQGGSSLLLVGAVAIAVTFQHQVGALLAVVGGQAMGLLLSAAVAYRKGLVPGGRPVPRKLPINMLGQYVLMALSVLVFHKLADYLVRDWCIETNGMAQTGIWQSAVRISESVHALFVGSVGLVFFPQVSALVHQRPALRSYLIKVLGVVVPLLAAGLLLLYVLRHWLLAVLFADSFVPAANIMHWQLAGDGCAMTAWVFMFMISARKQTALYLVLQAFSTGLYLLTIYLNASHGIEALAQAHLVRYAALLLVVAAMHVKLLAKPL